MHRIADHVEWENIQHSLALARVKFSHSTTYHMRDPFSRSVQWTNHDPKKRERNFIAF